jgi:hypothetical protein
MFNIFSHQENASENDTEILSYPKWNGCQKKTKILAGTGSSWHRPRVQAPVAQKKERKKPKILQMLVSMGGRREELLDTVGRNANYFHHYRNLYGFLKKLKREFPMIQLYTIPGYISEGIKVSFQ